jgi:hypothetical protein
MNERKLEKMRQALKNLRKWETTYNGLISGPENKRDKPKEFYEDKLKKTLKDIENLEQKGVK